MENWNQCVDIDMKILFYVFLGDADWFVLDENGTRRVNLEEETLEEISAAMESNEDQYAENQEEGIEETEGNTERITVGDFEPMVPPPNVDYVA